MVGRETLHCGDRDLRNSSLVVQFYILYSSLKLNDAAVKAPMKPENVANYHNAGQKAREGNPKLNLVFAVKFWGVFPSCTSDPVI